MEISSVCARAYPASDVFTQQQTALQAHSSGTSVSQPDLHREMLVRVKEFDGDDDKWPGRWFKLQSFSKAKRTGYEALIERIVRETDATNLTNAVMNNADKQLPSSLQNVLGLTMTDESKSLTTARKVTVDSGEDLTPRCKHCQHQNSKKKNPHSKEKERER